MNTKRRDFLKIMAVTVGAGILFPKITMGEERRRGSGAAPAELPLVKPGEGMAKTLNYVHKNTDVKDAALKTARAGVPFEKQSCANCMLYAKDGNRGTEEVGKCTLFQGQVVKASGWCNSWAKKA